LKYRAESVAKVTISARALLNRFALLFLIIVAFAIMLLGKAETVAVERVRAGVVDVVAPVMAALSQPIATVSAGFDRIGSFFSVYEENELLRQQNTRLLEWQSAALALAAENSTFRKMLNFVPERGVSFSAARVIGDSGGVFVRSVLINGGTVSGIKKGDAAVTGSGLVGRVAESGRQSGRVLLITDLNSRIPVVSEKERLRAILSGDNSNSPRLSFLPPNARLSVGERVVTSGHGGIFPAGLPVGTIFSTEDGTIRIRPFVDFDTLEYIRVITEFPGEIAGQIVPSNAANSRVK